MTNQLLEAALAHHNLGSYEEALKFLEAARSTLIEITRMELEEKRRKAFMKANRQSTATSAEVKDLTSSVSATSIKSSSIPSINNNVTVDHTLGLNIPGTPQISGVYEAQRSEENISISLDIDMYVTICMGNIYQSSGDDEQALSQYQRGWVKAKDSNEMDWAAVCLNSIGLVAYYNLRYELAFQSFLTVGDYRAKVIL